MLVEPIRLLGTNTNVGVNPIDGKPLATPITRRLAAYDPLISLDLTGRFSKLKLHSIPLNVIHISNKEKVKNVNRG